jgi:hypothetical protein
LTGRPATHHALVAVEQTGDARWDQSSAARQARNSVAVIGIALRLGFMPAGYKARVKVKGQPGGMTSM